MCTHPGYSRACVLTWLAAGGEGQGRDQASIRHPKVQLQAAVSHEASRAWHVPAVHFAGWFALLTPSHVLSASFACFPMCVTALCLRLVLAYRRGQSFGPRRTRESDALAQRTQHNLCGALGMQWLW
jgi:hypothetical protein